MKEEEVKKKYCPLYGCAVLIATSCSTKNLEPFKEKMANQILCSASDCMMWKWFDSNKTQGRCGLCVGGDS